LSSLQCYKRVRGSVGRRAPSTAHPAGITGEKIRRRGGKRCVIKNPWSGTTRRPNRDMRVV
jgi:hypothetical protein